MATQRTSTKRNGALSTRQNGTASASKPKHLNSTANASKAAKGTSASSAHRNGTASASKSAKRNGATTAHRNGTSSATSVKRNAASERRNGTKAASALQNGTGDHVFCAALVEGLALPPGEHFFTTMARSVAVALGARFGFVTKLGEGRGTLELLGLWNGETMEECFTYKTKNTPCEDVLRKGLVSIPKHVSTAYPKDKWLREIGAESYLAVPLLASDASALGHLGVMHDAPLPASDEIVAVLQALATRAAGELARENEHRQANQRIDRVEALVNKVATGVLQVDAQGIIVFANPYVDALFGYGRGELLGQPIELLVPDSKRKAHKPDRNHFLRNQVDGPMAPDRVVRGVRKDGLEFPVAVLLSSDGRGAVAIVADATKDKEAAALLEKQQARIESVVEAFPEMIAVVDRNGVNLDFIANGLEPHLSRDELIGKSAVDVLPKDVADQVLSCIKFALTSRQTQSMRYKLDWDDGTHSYEARYVRLDNQRVAVFIRDFTVEEMMANPTARPGTKANGTAGANLVDEVEHRMEWRNPYGLSYREFGVLNLLKGGTTDKEIAGDLGISVFTVNKHVSNILTKMNAASRTEATIRALQEGLID